MRRWTVVLALIATPALAGVRKDTASADAAFDDWRDCVVAASRTFAIKSTPSQAVEAAFGVCSGAEDRFREALWRWSSLGGWHRHFTRAELERQMALERRRVHDVGIAAAIVGPAAPPPDRTPRRSPAAGEAGAT